MGTSLTSRTSISFTGKPSAPLEPVARKAASRPSCPADKSVSPASCLQLATLCLLVSISKDGWLRSLSPLNNKKTNQRHGVLGVQWQEGGVCSWGDHIALCCKVVRARFQHICLSQILLLVNILNFIIQIQNSPFLLYFKKKFAQHSWILFLQLPLDLLATDVRTFLTAIPKSLFPSECCLWI